MRLNGTQAYGVTPPQYLGPFIAATKNKPTRIVFHNLLPTGADGDLFLPTDSSMMGSGMGPMPMAEPADLKTTDDGIREPLCTQDPKSDMCFKDNRATLHLHGGTTPWISDGTPHQWITPAGENTPWPQGVSVKNVPDMKDADGLTTCDADDDGCQTFFYTNQQSARLMFYHDHAWGITRLNVYAGEAAGYLIADDTEKKLITDGVIPGAADTLPLVIQDKTFVPGDEQLKDVKDADGNITSYGQDPTWDNTRWGSKGSLWYHHVYMPAQNPGDASGMSAYGRWMYGPWFWPPASGTKHGPIPEPLLRRELQDRRAVDLAVPDRPVLRARAHPRHAQRLGRHGAVQRHPDRQRSGLPEGHPRAQALPAADAQRRQRPVLQPPVVHRRPRPG